MRNSELTKRRMDLDLKTLKAVSSPVRLAILDYLKRPADHFPSQIDGDFISDGVCADSIREKLNISAATASRHLTLLTDAGLLAATRKKGWTFYRRNSPVIKGFAQSLQSGL
jgi:DNA-binding transcriptional ArsR family regulator